MRILHFIKGLGRGGAETLLVHALRHADRDRFHYEYAYMLPHKNALVAELEAMGAPVHLVPGRSKTQLLTAPGRLVRLVREREIDLIHAHLPVAGMVARFAGARTRTPVVYNEHNVNERYGRLTRWGNRATWSLNKTAIAVSQPVADSIRHNMGGSGRIPVYTIQNGIDLLPFTDERDVLASRRDLGLPPNAPIVGTVCVMRAQKRLDLWLRAAKEIVEAVPDVVFLIVGDGPLRPRVVESIQELGLQAKTHLPGLQENVRPYLAAMDVFLSSSDFEGLPLALIEAMAMGVPVVATRAGGVPGLLGENDDTAGRLVAPGDVNAMACETVSLLRNRGLLNDLGARARDRAHKHFGVDTMVRACEQIYLDLGR